MAEAAALAGLQWFASSPFLIDLLKKGYSYLGLDVDVDVDEKLHDLQKIIVPRMEILITAAENSPHKDRLRGWLKSLEDAVYEAEDALDLHDYYLLEQKVKVRRQSLSPIKNLLKKFSIVPQNVKLKKSLMNLEKTAAKANEILPLLSVGMVSNLRESQTTEESGRRVTTSLLTHKVFGRDKDYNHIINLLHESTGLESESSFVKNYFIVAIVGLGGAGKTTLAQYVCDREKEAKHFDVTMWVHVSQQVDVEKLTRKMVESASGEECPNLTNLDTLQKKLEDSLRSKKFLFVMDDVWSEKEVAEVQWEQLLAPLSVGNRGSRILMTTRERGVAEALGAKNILDLEELEKNDFLSLFMYHAFGDAKIDDNKLYKELGKVVRQNASKLHGSPLAARMVGSQLRKRPNVDFWNRILNEDLLKDTMESLLWSYQNLELHLQRCFSYCSLFPKGRQIRRNELIHLWIAEGFIKTTDETSRIKDKGHEYFDDLLSSSFFQPTEYYDSYVMHDLLHDLAEMVSKNRCLRIEGNLTKAIPREIRHLSLWIHRLSDLAEKICNLKNLRTLIVFTSSNDGCTDDLLRRIFAKLKKLRVVDLRECNIKNLPESIGRLKHLRHLDLRWLSFEFLPKSLSKLYHLEYLHIYKCASVPKGLANLINLRHLSDHDRMLSKVTGISKLSSLQSLEYFEVKKEGGHELKQLENLKEIRGSIHISGLENVEGNDEALEAKLEEKIGIDRLRLEWSTADDGSRSSDMDTQVLEGLRPPPQLRTLEITGYQGHVCPSWMAEDRHLLHNLKSLELNKCRQLEFLPDIANPSHELTDLVLRDLQKLKKLPILPPTMTKLVLDTCSSLECSSKEDIDIIRSTQGKRISQAMNFLEETNRYLFFELNSQNFSNWLERSIDSIYQNPPAEKVQLIPFFSLEVLEITSCPLTDTILRECLRGLTSLTHLTISDIVSLTSLPSADVLGGLTALQELVIKKCWLLTSLGGLQALGSLKNLVISLCPSPFVELPAQGGNASSLLLPSLESLEIEAWNSSNLDDLLQGATSLTNLEVEICPFVESLQLRHLKSLAKLSITDCPALGSLLGLQELEHLQELTVKACPKLARAKTTCGDAAGLRHLKRFTTDTPSLLYALLTKKGNASLNCLRIEGFKSELLRPEEERVFQHLTSLKSLVFENCCFMTLPDNLEGLSSLGILRICDCPNITSLPDLPRSLEALRLQHCNPVLKMNCREPHGRDWGKIAHIPEIIFN